MHLIKGFKLRRGLGRDENASSGVEVGLKGEVMGEGEGWSIWGSSWVVHLSSPWTRSIRVVHGPGVNEMYQPNFVSVCKTSDCAE